MSAQAFSQGVNLVIQLVSVPVFLHAWGLSLYGEWLALTSLLLYLSMADFGFGPICANEMTMLVARGDRRGANSTFQSVWVLTNIVSGAGVGLVAAAAWLLPTTRFLNLSQIDGSTATIVLALLAVYMVVGLQTSLLDGAFRCEGHYGLGAFLGACVRLFEFTLVVSGVLLGGGPVAAAGLYVVGRVLGTAASRVVLARYVPWVHYGMRSASLRRVRSLTRPALAYLAFPLGNALNLQGVSVVISASIDPAALAVFATLRALTRTALQLSRAINLVVWPEIGAAFGAGTLERVRELHRRACQVSLWSTLAVVVVVAGGGNWIVSVWSRGEVGAKEPLLGFLLAAMVLGALWWTSSAALLATNSHPRIAGMYLLASCVTLAGVYVSARLAGLEGVAAALLLFDATLAIVVPRQALRLIEEPPGAFVATLVRPPVFLLPASVRSAARAAALTR